MAAGLCAVPPPGGCHGLCRPAFGLVRSFHILSGDLFPAERPSGFVDVHSASSSIRAVTE